MIKFLTILSLNLFFIFMTQEGLANNDSLLVYDKSESGKNLPRNFRDLTNIGLNAIAGAQFDEKHLLEIKKKYPNEKIIIVDLRRESHGFIDGKAVSWRVPFDRSNLDKNSAEILEDEKSSFDIMQKNGEVSIQEIVEKDQENGWYKSIKSKSTKVKKASNEEELVTKNGFEYKRFAVQDHAKPTNEELENIVAFIKALPKDQKIYVHCAAGKGRTTTFLTIYDILKNGKTTSLDKILERQHAAGGSRLDKIKESEDWRRKQAEEKLEMVREFYNTTISN